MPHLPSESELRAVAGRLLVLCNQPLRPSEFARAMLQQVRRLTGACELDLLLFRGEWLHHATLTDARQPVFHYEVHPAQSAEPSGRQRDPARALTLPLRGGGELLGHLILTLPRRGAAQPAALRAMFEQLGEAASTAVTIHRMHTDLRERMKELTCLYGIARVADDGTLALPRVLQGMIDLVPPAWQYPELACARLTVDAQTFTSSGFAVGPFRQEAAIVVGGVDRGRITVFYRDGESDLGFDPFLPEEQQLLATIAREIGLVLERREAQEEKGRLQEQLRHADRLATIGQLAAGVAHELNEPLANILGFAQLIAADGGLVGQPAADLEKIVKASLHAREVIKKLLYFSRQMPAKFDEVEANRIVEDGLYFLESRCAKEGIAIERRFAPNLPPIVADPAQLNQVLVNLIVNAIQAMPGGGTLRLATGLRRGMVVITVEDTGGGMTDEVRREIFTPFFTTKEIGQGTGLGLSVAHGIVTAHGGSIEVASRPGHGARFDVLLPAIESGTPPRRPR